MICTQLPTLMGIQAVPPGIVSVMLRLGRQAMLFLLMSAVSAADQSWGMERDIQYIHSANLTYEDVWRPRTLHNLTHDRLAMRGWSKIQML